MADFHYYSALDTGSLVWEPYKAHEIYAPTVSLFTDGSPLGNIGSPWRVPLGVLLLHELPIRLISNHLSTFH